MNLEFKANFFHAFQDKALIKEVYCLRRLIFVETYKWDLKTVGQLEKDEFDTDHAIHCTLSYRNTIFGYFRCINCTKPYLASSKFPDLSREHIFPHHHDFWEVSKFGTTHLYPKSGPLLYALMFAFAEIKKAKSLVAIVDTCHESRLRRLGITTKRYGSPTQVGKDKNGNNIIAVAGEIPIADQSRKILAQFRKLTHRMKIQDQTNVQRPLSIPA